MFKPGDIVAVLGKPEEIVLNGLIEPQTRRFHHFPVGPSTDDGDYEIIEARSDGIRAGRLSLYKGSEVVVYRIDDEAIALRAWQETSKYGRCNYDYFLFIDLLAQANHYWQKNGFKPVPYTWFKSADNGLLICTELSCVIYQNVDFPLVIPGVTKTPAAIKAAYMDGKLHIAFEGPL